MASPRDADLQVLHPTLCAMVMGSRAELTRAYPHLTVWIIQTKRPEEKHNDYLRRGLTKVPYSDTGHNPDAHGDGYVWAVDMAVFDTRLPLDQAVQWGGDLKRNPQMAWRQRLRFAVLHGLMLSQADYRGAKIRWGGDFNRDGDFTNDSWLDMAHWELEAE